MAGEAKLTTCNVKTATAGAYFCPGIVTGGQHGVTSNLELHHGCSGTLVIDATDLSPAPGFTCKYTEDVKALVSAGMRGSYPRGTQNEDLWIQIATDVKGWTIGACAINSWQLSWTAPDVVMARFGFVGLDATLDTDGIAQVALAAAQIPHRSARMTITIDGAALECIGWEAGVENNYEVISHGDTRSSGSYRTPNLLAQGLEAPSLRTTVLVPKGYDLAADSPTVTHDIVLTTGDGTVSTVLTYTNVGIADERYDVREEENGFVPIEIEWFCYPGCLVVT